ncbi:MAG: hypothetical protein V3R64_09830 [Sphingomonadales bacterium]
MEKKPDKENQILDEALAKIQTLEPSPDLVKRIMADAEETLGPRPFSIFWPFGKIWQPVSVMAAAMVLGVWFGIDAIRVDNADVMNEIAMMLMG